MTPKKYTCRHPCPPWWTSAACCRISLLPTLEVMTWKLLGFKKFPTLKRMLPCSGQAEISISNIWFHKSFVQQLETTNQPFNVMYCQEIEASHLWRWHCYRDIDLRSPKSPHPSKKNMRSRLKSSPPFSSMKEQPTAKLEKNMYLKATNGTRSSLQVSRTMMELLKLTVLPWSTREGEVNPKGGGDPLVLPCSFWK